MGRKTIFYFEKTTQSDIFSQYHWLSFQEGHADPQSFFLSVVQI